MNEQRSGLGQRIPARSSRVVTNEYDLEEDEEYYVTRPHTSARRYDLIPDQVIQQGNKRYHIRHGSPPVPPRQKQYFEGEEQRKPRRVHWFVYLGIFFMAVVGFSFLLFAFLEWWRQKKKNCTYTQKPNYPH